MGYTMFAMCSRDSHFMFTHSAHPSPPRSLPPGTCTHMANSLQYLLCHLSHDDIIVTPYCRSGLGRGGGIRLAQLALCSMFPCDPCRAAVRGSIFCLWMIDSM